LLDKFSHSLWKRDFMEALSASGMKDESMLFIVRRFVSSSVKPRSRTSAKYSSVGRNTVDQGLVTQDPAGFTEVFRELKPYQQKELMRLVLHKAILGPDYVKMALYGRPPKIAPLAEPQRRFQTFKWLPGLVSESVVLWDSIPLRQTGLRRSM
jgi:hypothetical protein